MSPASTRNCPHHMTYQRPACRGLPPSLQADRECLTHKWTPLIVFALKQGPLRFTELRKAVPG